MEEIQILITGKFYFYQWYFNIYVLNIFFNHLSTIDDNEAYDNIDLKSQDEEDKYFDSESPENLYPSEDRNEVETEDELDIYMKSLKVN